MKTNYVVVFILVAVLGFGAFVVINSKNYSSLNSRFVNDVITSPVQTSQDQQLVGRDRDAHGCIGSAGYSWCDVKQKCLRPFEELCISAADQALWEKQIKEQIVAKQGPVANELTVLTKKVNDDYAQGAANSTGGGGLWFAAKIDGSWKLVWDGNGIILCSDLIDYPNFPTSLIPQCFNDKTNQIIQRE